MGGPSVGTAGYEGGLSTYRYPSRQSKTAVSENALSNTGKVCPRALELGARRVRTHTFTGRIVRQGGAHIIVVGRRQLLQCRHDTRFVSPPAQGARSAGRVGSCSRSCPASGVLPGGVGCDGGCSDMSGVQQWCWME